MIIEGVMGLFDGPDGRHGLAPPISPTTSICRSSWWSIVSAMAQSVAALVHGFAATAGPSRVAGVILNRVASARHERMLRSALASTSAFRFLGASAVTPDSRFLPAISALFRLARIPSSKHFLTASRHASPTTRSTSTACFGSREPSAGVSESGDRLAPLGQRDRRRRDHAFAFIYPHLSRRLAISQARRSSSFSPLADEAPPADADAVFLPGGYPELHADKLAAAHSFHERAARCRGAAAR